MKIIYLSSLYSEPKFGGGVKTYLEIISKELIKLGHKVTIVTSGEENYTEMGVHIIGVGTPKTYRSREQLLSPKFILSRINYMFRSTLYIHHHNCDIVESADGGFEHLFLVLTKKTSIVTRMHGRTSDTKNIPTGVKWLLNFLETFVENKTYMVSPSRSYAKYCTQKYKIILDRVSVIPYPIQKITPSLRSDVRQKYGLNGKKVVLFVGMLSRRKGIDMLVQTAKRLKDRKDVLFLVVGGNLEHFNTNSFPSNVKYVGHIGRDKIGAYFNVCDLFFAPSRFETFGIAVAEAMSYRKPIVASNTVGLKDVVASNKNGYLFKIGDYKEAASKIIKILDDKELKRRFGKKSKQLSEEYNSGHIAKEIENYYAKIVVEEESREGISHDS